MGSGVGIIKVEMIGFAAVPVTGDAVGLVHIGFKTGNRQEILIL